MLRKFLKAESGATAIEYGLLLAVLSLVIIGAFGSAVDLIQNNFETKAQIIEDSYK